MADLRRRLARLSRGRVCPRHHTPLTCSTCDFQDDLSDAEWNELGDYLHRIGVQPPPPLAPCQCGAPLSCDGCTAAATLEPAWAVLSEQEMDRVHALLGRVRRTRGGGRHGGGRR
jgi:hypothetical protein